MEDVGRVPAEVSSMPALEPATVPTLDGWIESLMNCKQLAEVDVQRLCEKVRLPLAPQPASGGYMGSPAAGGGADGGRVPM